MSNSTRLARLLAPCGVLLLTGITACATERQTDTPVTATEELLLSKAVDRSAGNLKLTFPADNRVFLDTQYYDTDNTVHPKYAIAAVRDQLLRSGAHIVDDRKDADTIVEMRSAVQSIDRSNFLIGIPSFPLPVPLAGTLEFPEIAFFKIDRQTGISSLALTAYDQKQGTLVAATDNERGESHIRKWVVLLVSWTVNDIDPPEEQKH
jgi:hypothetical protein